MDAKPIITIGIPCYQNVSAETLEDYMRLAYHLGRRFQEYNFYLAIKSKTEQFRARNAIVTVALQVGSRYLFMLDDDHIIDWQETNVAGAQYDLLRTLVAHLDADASRGIVGALYYQRGGDCFPVVMKQGRDGGFHWLRDDEIQGQLQEVAVTGGGCMLINCKIFDKIDSPWFQPENELGTDIQICKKARESGFTVWCDTSIAIGHVLNKREIITPQNRHKFVCATMARQTPTEGIDLDKAAAAGLSLYRMDAEEYLGMHFQDMLNLMPLYDAKRQNFNDYADPRDYYANMGKEQLARQVLFHHLPHMIEQYHQIIKIFNNKPPREIYGLDFGCGSAPLSFEMAMRGHRVDFIDIDGAGAYEFTKWRAKKRNVQAGFEWGGPYDYALLLDSLEHIQDWRAVIEEIATRLKPDGVILTNYFLLEDYDNNEHISMDKKAVEQFLISLGIYPLNAMMWVKRNLHIETMTAKEAYHGQHCKADSVC